MRRRLDPDQRRAEILRAAARAFTSRPYAEVQIGEIARDAGASRALVNHYFRDKRGLFLALIEAIVDRTPSVVRTDLELGGEAMVAANTAAWLDLVEASRETFLMLTDMGPIGSDADLEALLDRLRDSVADRMLANHLGTTEIPPPAHVAMRATLGLIERAVRDWLTGKGGSREQTEALIVAAIMATIRDLLPAVETAAVRDAERA
ncbi:MAG: TetR/AcrR family transcriptional regulator [Nitrososphaerota archaeon]